MITQRRAPGDDLVTPRTWLAQELSPHLPPWPLPFRPQGWGYSLLSVTTSFPKASGDLKFMHSHAHKNLHTFTCTHMCVPHYSRISKVVVRGSGLFDRTLNGRCQHCFQSRLGLCWGSIVPVPEWRCYFRRETLMPGHRALTQEYKF